MNLKSTYLAIIASLVACGCASTADTGAGEPVAEAVTADNTQTAQSGDVAAGDPDELICKKIRQTGTRFKEQICATRAEWERSEDYAQDATEKIKRRPTPIEY